MRGYLILALSALLVLVACSAPELPPEPVATSAVVVEFEKKATRSLGDSCKEDSDCLRPTHCLKGTCALDGLEDGMLCFSNSQCLSTYCNDYGRCSQEHHPEKYFYCEEKCKNLIVGGFTCFTSCYER